MNEDVGFCAPKNRKNQTLAIIYMLVLTVYILVDKVVIPATNGNKSVSVSEQIALLTDRTRRLEVTTDGLTNKVEDLIQGQATREEAIDNLKATADRIEKKSDRIEQKLDAHMSR